MKTIIEINQLMADNPKRFIVIKKEDGTQIGNEAYYQEFQQYGLIDFIKRLGISNRELITITVSERTLTGGIKTIAEKKIYVEPEPVPVQSQPIHQPMQNNYPPPPQAFGLGTVGMGIPDLIGLHTDRHRLEDKKEEIEKLKKELDEKKREMRAEIDDLRGDKKKLEIDNRELQSKLSISEQQKEMAVMMAKLDTKSFLDSDTFKALIEKAPELLGHVVAMKSGGGGAATALGMPAGSPMLQQFIGLISDYNDDQLQFLAAITMHIDNQNVTNEISTILQKYGNN